MVDWAKLPDVLAVSLLTIAFASLLRTHRLEQLNNWLVGWLLIDIHFIAQLFAPNPGLAGSVMSGLSLCTLFTAGLVFTWAADPYRRVTGSTFSLTTEIVTGCIYCLLLNFGVQSRLVLNISAIAFSLGPLFVLMIYRTRATHPYRRALALGCIAFGMILICAHESYMSQALSLALNLMLFAVYAGAAAFLCWRFGLRTAGASITVAGFALWAMVFPISFILGNSFPGVRVESEIWNLPKYIVAVGMILMLLEAQIERSEYLALHDDLTGLPNRRLFKDRLETCMARARRSGEPMALMMIDLDYFKRVNDTFGHHIGDQVLKKVTHLFTSRIRRSDTLARTGGDEFALILEAPVTRQSASEVAQTLITLLTPPIVEENYVLHIGASIGIAMFPEDAEDMQSLRVAADLNMYGSKQQGRNQFSFGGPGTQPPSPGKK